MKRVVGAAALLIVSGCAHNLAPPPPPPPPEAPPPVAESPAPAEAAAVPAGEALGPAVGSAGPAGNGGTVTTSASALDITPFTDFADNWFANISSASGGQLDGLYTRLSVTSSGLSGTGEGAQPLPYNHRWWLERYLWGTEFAVNLTVSVDAGLFKATVPLVTLDHKSSSDVGEQWSRPVYHATSGFPLFLVRPGLGTDTPQIVFELKDSIEYNSSVVAQALNAALTVAKDATPQSKVATTLAAPNLSAQAQAIDTAISKLFGEGVDEKHINQEPIRNWQYDQGIGITLWIPPSESNLGSAGKLRVGSWVISFEDPRPSIFADWRICDGHEFNNWQPDQGVSTNLNLRCALTPKDAIQATYKEVDANEVLGDSLIEVSRPGTAANALGSIGSYLSQQDWYKKALGDFGSSTNARTAAPEFCRHVAQAIHGVGLNSVDADIVVWAVPQAPDFPSAGRNAIKTDQVCGTFINDVKAQNAGTL